MTLQFRYHVPAGTRLANEGHTYALYPTGEGNIRAEDLETGRSEVWTLQEYLARSQRPGRRVPTSPSSPTTRRRGSAPGDVFTGTSFLLNGGTRSTFARLCVSGSKSS